MAKPSLHTSQPTAASTGWWAEFSGFWLRRPRNRRLLSVLAMSLWLLIFANQWLHTNKDIARPQRYLGIRAETIYVPPVEVLRVASLGNQSFVADLLFLRVAHYFVDHLLGDSQMPYIDLYLDAIWGLDAHNQSTYRWGAQVIKFGQAIDEDVNRRANAFARLGLEHFPLDGWLYHEIAYNIFAYRARYGVIERKQREAVALQYLAMAYQMPGFTLNPNYLAHQYARAGRMTDSVGAAMASYAAGTANERRELRIRLRQRDKNIAAATLGWLDHGHGRDWPILEETLSMVVGPKRITAPPITYYQPENWMPEHPVVPGLLKQLDIAMVQAPRGALDAGDTLDPNEELPMAGRPAPPAPPAPDSVSPSMFLPRAATAAASESP